MGRKIRGVAEAEERDREVLRRWREDGKRVYSEKETEDYVKENVNVHTAYCFHDWLHEIVKAVNKRCGSRKCFCIVDGEIYCDEFGYNKLADYFQAHGMIKKSLSV